MFVKNFPSDQLLRAIINKRGRKSHDLRPRCPDFVSGGSQTYALTPLGWDVRRRWDQENVSWA